MSSNSELADLNQGNAKDIEEYVIEGKINVEKLLRLLTKLKVLLTEDIKLYELGQTIKAFEDIRDNKDMQKYAATSFERRCNLEGIYKYEDIGIVAIHVLKELGLEVLMPNETINNIHLAEAVTIMTPIFGKLDFKKVKLLLTKPKEPTEEELKSIHELFSGFKEELNIEPEKDAEIDINKIPV